MSNSINEVDELKNKLTQIIDREKFDLIEIQKLRRKYVGSVGCFTDEYEQLSEFNTRKIDDLLSEEAVDLSQTIAVYFQKTELISTIIGTVDS